MDLRQAFEKTMAEVINMALATSVSDMPNVRLVTFGYDDAHPKCIYFTTFLGNEKIKEFTANPNVTALPVAEGDMQVRVHGRVRAAEIGIDAVAAIILKKAPFFEEMLDNKAYMAAYQIDFDEALITIGVDDAQTLIM